MKTNKIILMLAMIAIVTFISCEKDEECNELNNSIENAQERIINGITVSELIDNGTYLAYYTIDYYGESWLKCTNFNYYNKSGNITKVIETYETKSEEESKFYYELYKDDDDYVSVTIKDNIITCEIAYELIKGGTKQDVIDFYNNIEEYLSEE